MLEFIIDTIDHTRKVEHIRATTEKINDLMKKENDYLDIAQYKAHLEHLIDIGWIETKREGKTESIHVINSKISDNKIKTDSPKISDDLFNTKKAIEETISNNKEKVHKEYTFTDIPEKNEIIEQDKFTDVASIKQETRTK